jgi:DNA-binding NarL/FixJ family response regulator
VLLLDLIPGLFGIPVVKELKNKCAACKILVLTGSPDDIAGAQLLLAGVQGILSKDVPIDELVSVIFQVMSGRCNACSAAGVEKVRIIGVAESKCMTCREVQVLELVARGRANKQIAAELGISIKTVEKHRQSLMRKLRVHETAGLSWRAFCLGASYVTEPPMRTHDTPIVFNYAAAQKPSHELVPFHKPAFALHSPPMLG